MECVSLVILPFMFYVFLDLWAENIQDYIGTIEDIKGYEARGLV